MKLNYDSIYDENTSVRAYPNADLGGVQAKFLELGLNALKSYNLPDVDIKIEDVSSGGFFKSKSVAALTLTASFKPYKFTGVITVNTFGSMCVIGSYKSLDGQALFDTSKNTEEKKLLLLRKLSNLISIDYFNALESSINFAADSIGAAIDEAYSECRERKFSNNT